MKIPLVSLVRSKIVIVGVTSTVLLAVGGVHALTPDKPVTPTLRPMVKSSKSVSEPEVAHDSTPVVATPDNTPAPSTAKSKTYTNSAGNTVESPDNNPVGATAQCNDGTYSHSQSPQGTCSGHGGVKPAAPVCNQSLEGSYTAQYNAAKSAADAKHASNIQSIKDSWNARGLLFSGGEQQDEANENARYQTELASLQSQYQYEVASTNCQ